VLQYSYMNRDALLQALADQRVEVLASQQRNPHRKYERDETIAFPLDSISWTEGLVCLCLAINSGNEKTEIFGVANVTPLIRDYNAAPGSQAGDSSPIY